MEDVVKIGVDRFGNSIRAGSDSLLVHTERGRMHHDIKTEQRDQA